MTAYMLQEAPATEKLQILLACQGKIVINSVIELMRSNTFLQLAIFVIEETRLLFSGQQLGTVARDQHTCKCWLCCVHSKSTQLLQSLSREGNQK